MTTPKDNSPPGSVPELPSYLLEDDVEPVGWRRWLRGGRLIVTLIVMAMLAGALFGAKPAYRELKARRALAIAEQAGAALDRGDGGQVRGLGRRLLRRLHAAAQEGLSPRRPRRPAAAPPPPPVGM